MIMLDGSVGPMDNSNSVSNRVDAVMEQFLRRQFCTLAWLTITFLVLTFHVVLT